jgi:DNA-binding NarL/FixJ family response regulator
VFSAGCSKLNTLVVTIRVILQPLHPPEAVLPIKVLLADESDIMRRAISRVLAEEPDFTVVGEAAGFRELLKLTPVLKPDVLLMDLHMHDETAYPPEEVKAKILAHTDCIVAISIWNDEEAMALAQSFGARVLLDKTKLFGELIPAISNFVPKSQPSSAQPAS